MVDGVRPQPHGSFETETRVTGVTPLPSRGVSTRRRVGVGESDTVPHNGPRGPVAVRSGEEVFRERRVLARLGLVLPLLCVVEATSGEDAEESPLLPPPGPRTGGRPRTVGGEGPSLRGR